MRVLHLAPHLRERSGLAQYGESFRRHLRDEGCRVDTVDVPVARPLNSVFDVRTYVDAATRAAARADIVHAELGGGTLRQFYAVRALVARHNVCVTVHDGPRPVWFPWHIAGVRKHPKMGALLSLIGDGPAAGLENAVMRRVAHTFVTTSRAVDAVAGRYALGAGVSKLPYPWTERSGGSLRPGDSNATLRVAFHGHWYPGKGIETLVSAVASARDSGIRLHLTLLGDVSPSAGATAGRAYRRQILGQVRSLRLDDLLTLTGHVDDSVLDELLSSQDVLVLPYDVATRASRALASTSAAAHDAVEAGRPVICTRNPAFEGVVKHGTNGLVVGSGTEALANALVRLAGDRRLLVQLSEGALDQRRALRADRPGPVALARYREILTTTR